MKIRMRDLDQLDFPRHSSNNIISTSTMAGVGEEINLSHEEIWDDSALVSSWNEAYEEYQVSSNIPSHQ